MAIREIPLAELDVEGFIRQKVEEISSTVGDGLVINALSGGVDSSTVTMLGHRALGDRLKSYFIDNGIMRQDEPQQVVSWFERLGVPVSVVNAREEFFQALRGLTDPEEKREAITQGFYRIVFGRLVQEGGARFLLQGTNYTDVEETVAGVKRQHNVLEQLGIDTEDAFGYRVLEPIIELRKPAVRKLGRELGLPEEIFQRPPFPGPALAARILGEVTPGKTGIVRRATSIVEEVLAPTGAFQYMAILHDSKVTGVRDGRRAYGHQVEVRCWDSEDAVTGRPTRLPWETLDILAERITSEVPEVVSVTCNITPKPSSTIEAV